MTFGYSQRGAGCILGLRTDNVNCHVNPEDGEQQRGRGEGDQNRHGAAWLAA